MKREEAIAILDLSKLTAVSGRKHDEAVDMATEALQADLVRCKECKHYRAEYG